MKSYSGERDYAPPVLTLGVCSAIGIFAGLSASLFSLLLPQIIFHITGENSLEGMGRVGGYVMASFLIGWTIGGIAFGIVSDRFGRVKGIMLSIMIYSIATSLVPLASSMWHLHLMRCAAGIGVGGAMISCAVFLSESGLKITKGISLGVLVASYQAGVLLSGVVVGLMDWRYTFMTALFPLILSGLVFQWFIEPLPSKKKELVSKDKSHLRPFDYKKQMIFGSILFGSLLIGYWASLSWIPTWIEGLLWNVQKEKAMATILHGLMAILGCLVAGILSDRWGRRKLMMIAFIGAFLCSWKMFFTHRVFDPMIYAENGLLGFFIGMAQSILYVYLPELFPQRIRGVSVALCLNIGRVVTIAALFFVGYLVMCLGGFGGALSVFALFYLLGALAAWFAPETTEA